MIELHLHQFEVALSEEASTLGFPPGDFPLYVKLDGVILTRVSTHWDNENDITHVVYMKGLVKLTVFND